VDITPNNIPPELRRGVRFTCWRAEQIREGVWVKIPVDVHSGKDAACDNPATWATWDAALAFYQAYSNTVMGIGRMLVSSDVMDTAGRVLAARDNPGLMVVEITACLDTQKHLIRDAAQWVGKFNTYTETTSDGSGVSLWFYAAHTLDDRPQRTQQLEDGRAITMYRQQFAPLTGQHLTKYSGVVEHCDPDINALHKVLFGAEDARNKPSPPLWRRQRITTVPPPARNPTTISAAPSPARASAPLKIDAAKDFLTITLRNGAVEQARLIASAMDRGISVRTLRRAKRVLRVQSTRRTYQGNVLWTIRR
jgi:hypothetical protein